MRRRYPDPPRIRRDAAAGHRRAASLACSAGVAALTEVLEAMADSGTQHKPQFPDVPAAPEFVIANGHRSSNRREHTTADQVQAISGGGASGR